jgi:hypothetical protein
MNQAVAVEFARVNEARNNLRSIARAFNKEVGSRDQKLRAAEDALRNAFHEPTVGLVDTAISLSPEVQSLVNDPTRGLSH